MRSRGVRDNGDQRVKEPWNVARVKLRIGSHLRSVGLLTEAEELLRAAYATLLAQLGPKHDHTGAARTALRELYTALGRPAEAAAYASEESRERAR